MSMTATHILIVLTTVQIALFSMDEFYCHRKRGLPRWERIGHPVDTVFVLLTYAIGVFLDYNPTNLNWFILAAVVSCLVVTKDEFVHARLCDGFESLIHAMMFMVHPVMFVAFAYAWSLGESHQIMQIIAASALLVGIYQILYWNILYDRSHQ